MHKRRKKILVIAAHPDDEILGCGGTIARLIKEGFEAYTLILGEGITSREAKGRGHKGKSQVRELKEEMRRANSIIGVKEVFDYGFPDNSFDTVPLLDIVKVIEKIKDKIKPSIVFTHYEKDLNIDHCIIYKAVITAARPMQKESVKDILSFEVPSSTGWSYPLSFSPDVFFDITSTLELKLRALSEYKLELKGPDHPRSLKGVELNSGYWGLNVGLKHAEVFKSVRSIR